MGGVCVYSNSCYDSKQDKFIGLEACNKILGSVPKTDRQTLPPGTLVKCCENACADVLGHSEQKKNLVEIFFFET